MYLSQERKEQQWRMYLPFLYKFYFQHQEDNFVDVVGARFCKQPTKPPNQHENVLSFIVAGISQVCHLNQQFSYTIEENLIKSFQLILPSSNPSQSQTLQSKTITNQGRFPYVVEKKKVFYQRQITCLQDVFISQKNTSQPSTTHSHFYVVAIKNDSIRILSAAKIGCLDAQHRKITIFTDRSPFLPKNIKETNLCQGNQTEVAIIPLINKEIITLKFSQTQKSLLCACQDGSILMINLEAQLTTNNIIPPETYTYFTYHQAPVKDVIFLTYPDDERLLFASVGADGTFFLWKKQNTNAPCRIIEQGSTQPSSLIEVYPNQLIQGGRDCSLRFFDIKKGSTYNYNQNNQIITKLYNLTSLIQYQKNKKETHLDNSLRFVSCENSGKIVFWQGEKEFEHFTHKTRIASLDYVNQHGGMFIAVQKQTAKMSFFSPVLFTHCLQDVSTD